MIENLAYGIFHSYSIIDDAFQICSGTPKRLNWLHTNLQVTYSWIL